MTPTKPRIRAVGVKFFPKEFTPPSLGFEPPHPRPPEPAVS